MVKKAVSSPKEVVSKKTKKENFALTPEMVTNAKWGGIVLVVIAVIVSLGGLIYLVQNLQNSVGSLTNTISGLNTKVEALSQDGTGKTQNNAPANVAPTIGAVNVKDSPKKGNANAKVAVVEFSDFECPFCKRAYTQTLPPILKDYVDANKVVYVFKHYPLPFHDPIATEQAEATECAKEQKGDSGFYAMHDAIYDKTESNKKNMTSALLLELAKQVGLDEDKFAMCVSSNKFDAKIKADIAEGSKIGITGTPGFVIGKYDANTGKVEGEIIKGAVPYETFKAAIDKQLK